MKKLADGFNTAAHDSNPGSRSRESEALTLNHCVLHMMRSHVERHLLTEVRCQCHQSWGRHRSRSGNTIFQRVLHKARTPACTELSRLVTCGLHTATGQLSKPPSIQVASDQLLWYVICAAYSDALYYMKEPIIEGIQWVPHKNATECIHKSCATW